MLITISCFSINDKFKLKCIKNAVDECMISKLKTEKNCHRKKCHLITSHVTILERKEEEKNNVLIAIEKQKILISFV